MAIVAGRTEIGLKVTSTLTSVPKDNRAKLMYYLDCMCTVLKLDNPGIARLRQYEQYYLTEEETDALIILCYLVSPDELEGKCIFQSDELCGESGNKFYDLSVAQTHLAVTQSVLIGGERKRVQNIMTYRMSWLTNNWLDPIKALASERARQIDQQRRAENSSGCCVIL